MAAPEQATAIDLATWDRAEQFRFFRTYDRPHFATTARVNVTAMMQAKARAGLSPFRTCVWAIGAAIHDVPSLKMRFSRDTVTAFDAIDLSPTIALENGDFRYTYLEWTSDRAAFDTSAQARIAEVRNGQPLNANTVGAKLDVAYLSCLPWLDYTSLDNALPNAEDCIPRVSWGKIVEQAGRWDMAVTLQVHHALVDGRAVGSFFESLENHLGQIT